MASNAFPSTQHRGSLKDQPILALALPEEVSNRGHGTEPVHEEGPFLFLWQVGAAGLCSMGTYPLQETGTKTRAMQGTRLS